MRIVEKIIEFGMDKSNDKEEILATLHQKPSSEQIYRVENFQLTIATGIISVFLATFTVSVSHLEAIRPILGILSLISFIYLFIKLQLITIRPYTSHRYLERLDFLVLPFAFSLLFLVFSILVLYSLMNIYMIEFDGIIEPAVIFIISVLENKIFITLYIVVTVVISGFSATKTATKMSVLETGVPEIQFTFSSGQSGDALPLRIHNPYSEPISPDDIEIRIESSAGVNVDLPNTKQVDDKTWKPHLPIKPDGTMELSIRFTRPEEKEELSRETATVTVEYDNHSQQHEIHLQG